MPARLFTALVLAFTLIAAPALAAKEAQLSEQERTWVKQIDAYFNGLESVKGRFTQIGPNGEFSEGTFYLDRPGKMRFEYADPNPILVVSDGSWVGIEDRRLKSTQKYPLSTTPLKLMLGDNVNLLKDAEIVSIEEREGDVAVTVEANSAATPGQLTLIFGGPDFALKQWVVVDAQGLRTQVSLFDLVRGAKLNEQLFWIDDNLIFDTKMQ